MYKVYCDDSLLYDGKREELKIFSPSVSMELNKVGSFNFTIYPTHKHFSKLQKMKSIIKVYRDESLIFKGRILNDTEGFHNEKKVTCESDLAFLIDSVQRPYSFQGDVSTLFKLFIDNHNLQVDEAHQFKIGKVTVTDPNNYIPRSDTQYLTTWESINKKLIEPLGGYLIVRYEDDGTYLDYLSELSTLSTQEIEFGKNMIDFEKVVKGDDIATAIIPLGATINEETSEKLTIKSVNNGVDYVYDQEAVNKYGWIFKTQTWEDVTVADNLLRKANEYLSNTIQLVTSIELNAIDLSYTNNKISSFKIGTNVKVFSKPHNLNTYFLVSKLSLDLLNPVNDKLTLGTTYSTFTEQSSNNQAIIDQVTVNVGDKINESVGNSIAGVEERLQSKIDASSGNIITTVSQDFVSKDDFETLQSSVSTEFEQTKSDFQFSFNEFNLKLDETNNNTTSEFENIRKYIRFEDGNIILGESNNELTLKIENDKISFYESNNEIAYFQNRKLFVEDGEFLNSLQLGKFAFMPRENGNLSFGKVVN